MTKVAENAREGVLMGENSAVCLFQGGLQVEDDRETPAACRQEINMAMMNQPVSTIADAVNEIKEGQKENNKLMRDIAVQGAKVDGLVETLKIEVADRKHVNDILFIRVQALEQAPIELAKTRNSGLWGAVTTALISAIVAIIIAVSTKH